MTKIFFAGAHDGSNTNALLKYCTQSLQTVDCYTFGEENWDVVFTNNGRLVANVPGRLKVNTQHGNLFLGDTAPEPQHGINAVLASSESEKSMMIRNGYPDGAVFVTGQPRMDLLHAAVQDKTARNECLKSLKLDVGKPTILYAPTYSRKAFGGGSKLLFASSTNETCDKNTILSLLQICHSHHCNLIIRMHKYIKRDYDGELLPDYVKFAFDIWSDVNVHIHDNDTLPNSIPVLAASDILITDFSSIAADFMALDREILFVDPHRTWHYTKQWHAPKEDRQNMGFVCEDYHTIHTRLAEILYGRLSTFPARREAAKQKYQPFFDGRCCERVMNTVLERLDG